MRLETNWGPVVCESMVTIGKASHAPLEDYAITIAITGFLGSNRKLANGSKFRLGRRIADPGIASSGHSGDTTPCRMTGVALDRSRQL